MITTYISVPVQWRWDSSGWQTTYKSAFRLEATYKQNPVC